jgi:tetratricopeptide (TPR) repeat protein
MHAETCEATRVRGEQSESVMDLRIACLHRARLELLAVVDVLSDATPTTVENAHEVVDGLPALLRCADVEALQADVPPPEPDEAEVVVAIRGDLADATARRRAGEYAAAFAAVSRADTASAAIAYQPVRTEVLVELGTVHNAMGRYDDAEAALRHAQQLGARWQQWDAVRIATVRLILVLGYEKAGHAEALALRELALGLSADAPEAEAWARNNIALVLSRQGKYEEAEAEHLSALELRRAALGPDHPVVASSRNNLANVLIEQGRYAEAEAEYRAAFDVRSAALGIDHPEVAASRNNLGLVLHDEGN